jgi:hypothetical protein
MRGVFLAAEIQTRNSHLNLGRALRITLSR